MRLSAVAGHLSQRRKRLAARCRQPNGGTDFGFDNLSFSSVPVWAWAALAPGFFLFAKERSDLISAVSKVGLKGGRCFRTAAEFTLAQSKRVGGIAAGFMVGIVAAGALFSSSPFLGFGIMSGVITSTAGGLAPVADERAQRNRRYGCLYRNSIALPIAAGRGLAALVAHMRQLTNHLTMGAGE